MAAEAKSMKYKSDSLFGSTEFETSGFTQDSLPMYSEMTWTSEADGFQLCPKCNGEGHVNTSSVCPVCVGKMIINRITGKPPEI